MVGEDGGVAGERLSFVVHVTVQRLGHDVHHVVGLEVRVNPEEAVSRPGDLASGGAARTRLGEGAGADLGVIV
ncbi:hypothetical protein [Streptomyces decoyicus]|uniref:hypothetical protein n=1 Tax=Streptomyces decoyicus TaxID=249567 RepID=UPI00364C44AE